jgi:hypothetical protein
LFLSGASSNCTCALRLASVALQSLYIAVQSVLGIRCMVHCFQTPASRSACAGPWGLVGPEGGVITGALGPCVAVRPAVAALPAVVHLLS